ncbi:hypothetical protein AB2M62_13445 [Sphingomonas sp. MMS12-HWE2-04]|uniref:PAS domain-containing protein n=1 Tax=Sphingomonas sp. MMS12-HWE2-04 TaxID=3234199 RepID=UPI00384C2786
MDMARGLNDPMDFEPEGDAHDAAPDPAYEIGSDERRMHVRAYNHWVSLLHGRAYPSIEDLDPDNIADFGPHSVLLDFSKGVDSPSIRYLGRALREECGVDRSITHVAQVPTRSLLSRLTDHYLQIIANRAPIGFEAEFVGQRGHNTLYRGILMPFSSDSDGIDFIYGVINWKELVDAETEARIHAEIAESRRGTPAPAVAAIWADGPSAGFDSADVDGATLTADASLADRLHAARELAAAVTELDNRSRAALYRALGRAYDFLCVAEGDAAGYAELLADAGLTVQARAPMTPVVKLVFGADYDKTRVTEFAAVLGHARRILLPLGGLEGFLDMVEGGIKGVVKAERELRRPTPRKDVFQRAAEELRSRPPLGHVQIDACGDEFVVLLARAGREGLDIVARFEDDQSLTERAIRKAAA